MSRKPLFGDLEFARIDNSAAFIPDLEDINTAVEIGKIDYCFGGRLSRFKDLLPYKAINLYVILFIVVVLEIEIDQRSGGIGVKANDLLYSLRSGEDGF